MAGNDKIDIHWLWPIMAKRAGLNPDDFTHDKCWSAGGKRKFSDVEKWSSAGGDVVLKIVKQPRDTARVEALQDLQAKASKALTGSTRAPKVYAHDREGQAILMEGVAGTPLFKMIEGAEDHAPWLRRLGAWLAALHRATQDEERTFRPQFNIRFIQSLIADDSKAICDRGEFVTTASHVLDQLPAYGGLPTITAAQHGDANLHNFVWDGDVLWGLDFSNPDIAPVGYDVARALLHYAVNFCDIERVPPGQLLPDAEWNAFFEGYDLAGPDDPSIQTMLRARLVNDWVRFPGKRSKMPFVQQLRFERAKAVLTNVVRHEKGD